MGKLHKIRREIEKDPSKWVTIDYKNRIGGYNAVGAGVRFGIIKPMPWYIRKSYLGFVKHVCESLGYKIGVSLSDIGQGEESG